MEVLLECTWGELRYALTPHGWPWTQLIPFSLWSVILKDIPHFPSVKPGPTVNLPIYRSSLTPFPPLHHQQLLQSLLKPIRSAALTGCRIHGSWWWIEDSDGAGTDPSAWKLGRGSAQAVSWLGAQMEFQTSPSTGQTLASWQHRGRWKGAGDKGRSTTQHGSKALRDRMGIPRGENQQCGEWGVSYSTSPWGIQLWCSPWSPHLGLWRS